MPDGASAIQCCYAAKERRESSALTNMVESKNKSMIFCSAKKIIVEEKISHRLEFSHAYTEGFDRSLHPGLSSVAHAAGALGYSPVP